MPIHKKIESASAGVYYPFALNRLRAMENLNFNFRTRRVERSKLDYPVFKTYLIGNVKINIHYSPDGNHRIRLSGGGGLRYEFFTSDIINLRLYASTPYAGEYVFGHSVASVVNCQLQAMSSWDSLNGAPLLSATEPLSTDVPAWITRTSFNNQKLAFCQSYTTKLDAGGNESILYTTTPVTGQQMFAHDSATSGAWGISWDNNGVMDVDVGWDVRQPVYQNSKKISSLQPLLQPPFWWRRGTVAMALDDALVAHPITIVTDAMSNFYFFRTDLADSYTVSQTGYADKYVPMENRVFVPANSFLPSGVEVPTIDTMRPAKMAGYPTTNNTAFVAERYAFVTTPFNAYSTDPAMPDGDTWMGATDPYGAQWDKMYQEAEYLWVFNSDGSRAAAIVNDNLGDALYWQLQADQSSSDGVSTKQPIKTMRWGFSDLWVPACTEAQKAAYFTAHGGLRTMKSRPRGLLELNIALAITGPGPTDFTATITVNRQVQKRHYIDVEYAKASKALTTLGVAHDDLLATELELYSSAPVPSLAKNLYNLVTVRDITTGVDSTALLRWRMNLTNQRNVQLVPVYSLDIGALTQVSWLYSAGGGVIPSEYAHPWLVPDPAYGAFGPWDSLGNPLIGPYGDFCIAPQTIGGAVYPLSVHLNGFPIASPILLGADPNAGTAAASPARSTYNLLGYQVGDIEPPTGSATSSATIFATDLKSLSFVVATRAADETNRALHLYINGALDTTTNSAHVAKLTEFPALSTMTKIPAYPDSTWMTAHYAALNAAITAYTTAHPSGASLLSAYPTPALMALAGYTTLATILAAHPTVLTYTQLITLVNANPTIGAAIAADTTLDTDLSAVVAADAAIAYAKRELALETYDFWAAYKTAHNLLRPSQAVHHLHVHPSGSFAAYVQDDVSTSPGSDPVIDVIVDRDPQLGVLRTTHKAEFNKAFAQTRAYADYATGGTFAGGKFATGGMFV